MKISKKWIALSAVSLVVVCGGVAVAMPDKPEAKNLQKADNTSKVETVEQVAAEPVAPVEAPAPAPVQAVAPEPIPAPQPAYGEDPANPGTFRVFDKVALMNEVGIPAEQHEWVIKTLNAASNWTYKAPSGQLTLCTTIPSKMAPAGADYETNPATQLKWCKGYVDARYGGDWSKAYQRWQSSHWF